jgi:polysaccharide chain length determinant protein (PEP-CTERM system associated)
MNTKANLKSNMDELPELFNSAQEPAPKRFSWNDIRYYLNLLLRFRWALIVPFCLSMAAGTYYALTVNPVYEASTLVLAMPPDVPSNIVRPVVSESLESQMATISQQIKSRSNLEKVIADFKLFSDPKQKGMFTEDKLVRLREDIKIDLIQSRSRDGSNAFSISFRSNDPEKTMKITNALASNFIDSNLEYREEKAVGTTNFLESELDAMRTKLQETESQMSVFRSRYMGELPEQLQSNLQLLSSLETQLSNRQERLRDERGRLMIAQNEVEQIRREMQGVRSLPGSATAGQPQPTGPMTLAQLREQLASLQGAYTEQHPDVVRLKGMIAEMEAREPVPTAGIATGSDTLQSISSPLLREAVRRRMEAEANIASIQMEVNQINQQIREYRLRIERTPQREEQLASLNRDYNNIRQAYDSLLARKVEADMAVSIQKKNKGEQFRVIDAAKLPEKPVSPNMQRLFLMFIAAGLGIGAGIVVLYEFFDHTVRKPETLQARLSLPVLMVMPAMELVPRRLSRVKNWLNNGLSVVGVLVSLGLFACLAAVTVLNQPRAAGIITGIIKGILS